MSSDLRSLKRALCYYFRCQLLWCAAPFPNSGGTGEGERRFFRNVAETTTAALNRYHHANGTQPPPPLVTTETDCCGGKSGGAFVGGACGLGPLSISWCSECLKRGAYPRWNFEAYAGEVIFPERFDAEYIDYLIHCRDLAFDEGFLDWMAAVVQTREKPDLNNLREDLRDLLLWDDSVEGYRTVREIWGCDA